MTAATPFVPSEVAVLAPFVEVGLFDAAAVQVAAVVARSTGCSDLETLLGAALATRAIQEGDVCVLLEEVASSIVIEEADSVAPTLPWPEPATWAEVLANSPAIQLTEAPLAALIRPLVLDHGRLYLERYWRFEQLLADELIERASGGAGLYADSAELDEALDAVFGRARTGEIDLQRAAARHALTRPITVIAGGPGTGKTRTIAGILAVARRRGERPAGPVEFALAAPSAKAAGRIAAAVEQELKHTGSASSPDGVREVPQATTIHRLLGARNTGGFRHDEENPLLQDLVVIDEASMVSLELMAHLLRATRSDASLVLVGDPYQLASVEAGAVLSEIIGTGRPRRGSGALSASITLLERTLRFAADSGIAAFAAAVREGEVDLALQLLQASSGDELRWITDQDQHAIAELEHDVAEEAVKVVRYARDGDAEGALAVASARKVLCGTRLGPLGVGHWSGAIETILARELQDSSIGRRWYVGKPVLVTRNDYLNRTFNGDTGIVIRGREGQVVMLQDPTGLRELPTAQLSDVDTWWAMTIHKSQGSEFDEVVVSLPASPSPILSRELLYTAVTRARHRVTIVASKRSLEHAIAHPVSRASGLGIRLWG